MKLTEVPHRLCCQVVAVLYSAGQELAASRPELLGCAENGLGLRAWLEEQGHTFIGNMEEAVVHSACPPCAVEVQGLRASCLPGSTDEHARPSLILPAPASH